MPIEVDSATIDSIAASAPEIAPAVAPEAAIAAPATTHVRRLPIDYSFSIVEPLLSVDDSPLLGTGRLYERHEGGLLSRALGQAVHTFLQNFSQLYAAEPARVANAALSDFLPSITSQIRAMGVDPKSASRIAQQALRIARNTVDDPIGRWILGPHV